MTVSTAAEAASMLLYNVYAAELRVHAVMLIWLGYHRLKIAAHVAAEEDNITGELVRAMRIVLQDPSSPDWVDHYEIGEQVRQNVPGKLGKRRPIMDIEIRRPQRGPCPCLGFEAKRLGRGNAVGAYLGSEGLGAFLSGHYPTTHGEAGMVGYIQEKTNDEWSKSIAEELARNATTHRLATGGEIQAFEVAPAVPAFCSGHCGKDDKPLLIIHVLLSFVT